MRKIRQDKRFAAKPTWPQRISLRRRGGSLSPKAKPPVGVQAGELTPHKASKPLAIGGVAGGMALMGTGALALGVVLTPVTAVAGAAMVVALFRLWPRFAFGILPAAKPKEPELHLTPLETLELAKRNMLKDIEGASRRVNEAVTAYEALNWRYHEGRITLTPETQAVWEERVLSRGEGLRLIQSALADMRERYHQVVLLVENAKTDLVMAEAESNLVRALEGSSHEPTSLYRFDQALNEIKHIGKGAQSNFDMVMRAYQERLDREKV